MAFRTAHLTVSATQLPPGFGIADLRLVRQHAQRRDAPDSQGDRLGSVVFEHAWTDGEH